MDIAVILGAGKPAMEERLEAALIDDHEQYIITGTPQEMHYLDDQLRCLDLTRLEAYSTWGNYVAVCDAVKPFDEITFYGHESHSARMRLYQEYFSEYDIKNVVLRLSNLDPKHRAFDRLSATAHRALLRTIPKTMKKQARNRNSCLNRYIIPVKNRILNIRT